MTFRFSLYQILGAAAVLLLIGAVLPFLMMLQILETSFLLSFLSFGATVSGALLGYLGTIALYLNRRGPQEPW